MNIFSTSRDKTRAISILSLLSLLLGIGIIGAAAATTATADSTLTGGTATGTDAKKEYWQRKYAQIMSRASGAELRVEASRAAYREARQRDRPRGAERQKLVIELESAEAEYQTASKLLADFPEKARRAGVPPGWLREVEESKEL